MMSKRPDIIRRLWPAAPAWLLGPLLLAAGCAPTLRTTQLTEAQLPRGLHYQGQLVTALTWTDQQGPHLCAVTMQGRGRPNEGDPEDGIRSIGYLHHYQLTADSLGAGGHRRLRSHFCQLAPEKAAVQRTLQVTDLNHDGYAEIWLLYYRSCRVNNERLGGPELMMYQQDKYFSAVGAKKGCTLDSAFLKGPKVFRRFATRLWRREAAANAAQNRAADQREAAADKKAAAGP